MVAGETIQKSINRKKFIDDTVMDTQLNRCLGTFDICFLGVGHMVGAGIYVLSAKVAKSTAGPGVVLSYLIAGVTSVLAAMSYAEFAAQVPKAGSAYIYAYVTLGELWAFLIGWDVVLEAMIGAASVARAFSEYLNGITSQVIKNGTESFIGKFPDSTQGVLGEYPDFIASGMIVVLTLILCLGVKGSARFNATCSVTNVTVAVFIIVYGLTFANFKNWTNDFLPFKIRGVLRGTTQCFFAYTGFDSIATSSEETKNPGKSVPRAMFIAMLLVTILYFGVSSTQTLMIPYNEISGSAGLPGAFAYHHIYWAQYAVTVGAMCGMTTSMFGSMYILPRTLYAMANDGLFFPWFKYVNKKTHVPVVSLVVCSLFTAAIAFVFGVEQLVLFSAVGNEMAYIFVSTSVILLRYRPMPSKFVADPDTGNEDSTGRLKPQFNRLSSVLGRWSPGMVVLISLLVMIALMVCAAFLLQRGTNEYMDAMEIWAVVLMVLLLVGILGCLLVISAHQQNNYHYFYKVPLTPWFPALCIFLNVVLMTNIEWYTWARYLGWMIVGLIIYFSYGMWHSKERYRNEQPLEMTSATEVPTAPPQYSSDERYRPMTAEEFFHSQVLNCDVSHYNTKPQIQSVQLNDNNVRSRY